MKTALELCPSISLSQLGDKLLHFERAAGG